jgi:uncharacterized protein YbjQ (UPF0145 family)
MQLSGLIHFSIPVLFIITGLIIWLRRSLYKSLEKLIVLTERSRSLRGSDAEKELQNIDISKKKNNTESKSSNTDISKEEKDCDVSEKSNDNTLISKLEKRYATANDRREQVNTFSLIENVYKEEKISCLGKQFDCDWAESITRTLPNLLIAFGLIGTFIGITKNLTSISTILENPNENDIIKLGRLKQPLEAMGIAFSTSLVGLTFGSFMTIANTYWNTSIAKNQLFASLEDYLDNSYSKGDTPLYKAVKEMVQQQEQFLTRFHDNVTKAVENSLGEVAKQIAKEFSEINKIAIDTYTKFSNAAGTISTGASTFEYAANSLKSQNQTLADSLREFKGGVEIFKIAANQIEQNNIVQNLDRILGELNTSQQAFANSTQALESSLVGISSSNQTAAELAKNIYLTWQTSTEQMSDAAETIGAGAIIFQQSTTALQGQTQTLVQLMPQLQTGVDAFVTGAERIKQNNIIKRLDTVVGSLRTTQQAFANSTQTLATGVEGIVSSNQEATQLAQQVYHGLEVSSSRIYEGANSFVDAAQLIHDSSLAIDLTSAAETWQTAQAEFANSTAVFSQAAEKIQPVVTQLEPAITSIDRAVDSLQQFGTEVVTLSQNTLQISESTKATVSDIDRNHQTLLDGWNELRCVLNTDNDRSVKSIESLQEYLDRRILIDAKLLTVIEKIESKLNSSNSPDSYADKQQTDSISRFGKLFNNDKNN